MADDIPARLVAGDTWSWSVPAARFPAAEGGSLTFVLRPEAAGVPVSIEATREGSTWSVRHPAANTAAAVPGRWACHAVAFTAEGDRVVEPMAAIEVLPDPLTFTGDARSEAARILEAIDATLAGRVTDDVAQYSIEGRSLTRIPVPELMQLRRHYAARVAAERGRSPFTLRRVTH